MQSPTWKLKTAVCRQLLQLFSTPLPTTPTIQFKLNVRIKLLKYRDFSFSFSITWKNKSCAGCTLQEIFETHLHLHLLIGSATLDQTSSILHYHYRIEGKMLMAKYTSPILKHFKPFELILLPILTRKTPQWRKILLLNLVNARSKHLNGWKNMF